MTERLSKSDKFNRSRMTAALKAELMAEAGGEYAIHKAIVECLTKMHKPGVVWFHCPSGIHASGKAMNKMKALGFIAGVSDLCISSPNGQFLFMEIKAPRGRTSKAQDAFLDAMVDNGHWGVVVRSLDEAIDELEMFGAIRATRVAA